MKTTVSTETHHVVTPRGSHASAPEVLQAMLAISQSPAANLLDLGLLELVRMRASQLNRCGFCLDMHHRDAKARGETDERLVLLPAWEEVSCYTARERAALRWTEALTRLGDHGVSDEIFAEARAHFSEKELFHVTLAIVVINGWNRFNVAFHIQPGTA